MLFEFVAYLTGLTVLVFVLLAWVRHRDPFHPAIYIGLMLFFLYSFQPLYLTLTQAEELRGYLRDNEMLYVQVLNAVGVLSLCAGILAGSGRAGAWYRSPVHGQALPPVVGRRLAGAALVLGVLGVASYLYQVMSVGGFAEAYGGAYGGGWADLGYIREAMLLTVPALLLLMTARINRRLSGRDWFWALLFAAPLLVHGLLGARRGPMFLIAIALCAGWYFMRSCRPRLTTCTLAGLSLGLLMLLLVANRGEIYLGSNFSFDRGLSSYVFEAEAGNEFVYGAGSILHADVNDKYWWGRRYAIILFIRPIPRFLWPTKYEDTSAALSVPNLENNLGTGGDAFGETLGWAGAVGAAPGIVADIWTEFWLVSFLVLFVIGWCYGKVWSRAVRSGGAWVIGYCLMFSLSVYLVMQTLEAMLFRFLLLAVPVWLAWRYAQYSTGSTQATILQGRAETRAAIR